MEPLVGGGDPPDQAQREAYVAQERGALVSWNMPTFTGTEQSDPNLNVDTFAPTGLDVDNWLDACVSAGMTYAVLVTKHHDGFALWPTAYHVGANPPYSIAQTAFYASNGSPDIVDLFVAKCRIRNLNPCLYFSIQDTTHEARSGTDETTDPAGYLAMVVTQITELLTDYGDITALWFDRWGSHVGYAAVPYVTIYDLVKSLQPNCLLLDNCNFHPPVTSEIEVYEAPATEVPSGNARLSELVKTVRVNGHWFFNQADDQSDAAFTAAATILTDISTTNSRNAAYLLGIMPNKAGVLPAALVTRLGQL
jgi:alpha-L-fucosidase